MGKKCKKIAKFWTTIYGAVVKHSDKRHPTLQTKNIAHFWHQFFIVRNFWKIAAKFKISLKAGATHGDLKNIVSFSKTTLYKKLII